MKTANALRTGLAMVALALAVALGACAESNPGEYLNLRNGTMDPSQVARFDQKAPWGAGGAGGAGGRAEAGGTREELWIVPTGPAVATPMPATTAGASTFSGGLIGGSGGSVLKVGGGILDLSGSIISNSGSVPFNPSGIQAPGAYDGGLVLSGAGTITMGSGGTLLPANGNIIGGLVLGAGALTFAPATSPSIEHRTGQEVMRQNIESGQGMPLPGSPVLAARQADGKLVPVPLKHTDVKATISGYIASVGVTQEFTNPYSSKIEAVYVFPLPENAGINEFVMVIGERHIRGIVRERAEAEQIYQQAKAQGYTASLMTQERPNIFTQNVANIEPGKNIDIQIRYFHTLTYNDGWFEWVFPMVVGPRYNPAGFTQGVGAVAAGMAGASGQKAEVQYLRPEERSGHDIALQVQLDAGMTVEELQSVNHRVRKLDAKNSSVLVQLDPADTLPNKDFVLRYKVAGQKTKTGLFVQKDKDGKGGYFTLMIVPPAELKSLPRRGVEMVFVVDTSGSMSGRPIAQAKAAVDMALQKMDPSDTFQVVNFASSASQMSPTPLPVTAETVAAAHRYVAALHEGGGTEFLKGINAALDFPHEENRTRVVAFLTDGYIGNETQVLQALHEKLQDSRVFSFGVGTSVNRYLLDAMARLGHGNAAYLSPNDTAEPVMAAYFERISHPALANVKLEFSGMKVSEMYPQRIPELFVGRPIIVTGRYTGTANGDVKVSGRVGDEKMTYTLSTGGAMEENPAIGTVWARMKVADLHDEAIYEGRDVTKDVKETALTFGIMSEYTSFIAVDSAHVTEGDHGTTVAVPVPVPEGVRYDTTVQTGAMRREN